MNDAGVVAEPPLAPPGAGLPKLELWLARLIFRRACRRTSVEEALSGIESEEAAILATVAGLTPVDAGKRVLIGRLRGMEDSSRNWSVYMTLDHLRIVNSGVAGLLSLLLAGRRPEQVVGTADVKPSLMVGPEVVAAFCEANAAVRTAVSGDRSFSSSVRQPHPWFGPLEAAEWLVLVPFHMRLHRRQIERIVGELRGS